MNKESVLTRLSDLSQPSNIVIICYMTVTVLFKTFHIFHLVIAKKKLETVTNILSLVDFITVKDFYTTECKLLLVERSHTEARDYSSWSGYKILSVK